jgi:hypothetical protein
MGGCGQGKRQQSSYGRMGKFEGTHGIGLLVEVEKFQKPPRHLESPSRPVDCDFFKTSTLRA